MPPVVIMTINVKVKMFKSDCVVLEDVGFLHVHNHTNAEKQRGERPKRAGKKKK